jgi:hypothetical protein
MPRPRRSFFIQRAIHKPGSFTAYCRHKGYNGVTSGCIAKGKISKDSKTRHRANFADTLRHLPERS